MSEQGRARSLGRGRVELDATPPPRVELRDAHEDDGSRRAGQEVHAAGVLLQLRAGLQVPML